MASHPCLAGDYPQPKPPHHNRDPDFHLQGTTPRCTPTALSNRMFQRPLSSWHIEAIRQRQQSSHPMQYGSLEDAMHALDLENNMHLQPFSTSTTAETTELAYRMDILERSMYQQTTANQRSGMQTNQMLQILQREVFQLKQAVHHNVPKLYQEISSLQANLNHQQILQTEPRSQQEKLDSAMKNPQLVRIANGSSLQKAMTATQAYIREAEELESLAKALRSRVHIGGAAYVQEAEDAETLAATLRQSALESATKESDVAFTIKESGGSAINEAPKNNQVESAVRVESKTHDAEVSTKPAEAIFNENSDTVIVDMSENKETKFSHIAESSTSQDASVTTGFATVPFTFNEVDWNKPSSYKKSISVPPCSTHQLAEALKVSTPKQRAAAPHRKYAAPKMREAMAREPRAMPPHRKFAIRPVDTQVLSAVSKVEAPYGEHVIEQARVPDTSVGTTRGVETQVGQQSEATKSVITEAKMQTAGSETKSVEAGSVTSNTKKPEEPGHARIDTTQDASHQTSSASSTSSHKPKPHDSASISPSSVPTVKPPRKVWQPSYLRALPALPAEDLAAIPSQLQTFSRSFLFSKLSGIRHLSSFYHVPTSERSLLPNRGYFLLEPFLEPLRPSAPGHHGSLVTPVLRLPSSTDKDAPDPEAMISAPLFVGTGKDGVYSYYGMYTYLRSDRLDTDRCANVVPTGVKKWWASHLVSKDRPEWVTEMLAAHLSRPPTYSGPLPSSSGDANDALQQHIEELGSWSRDSGIKTSFLRAENVMTAFEAPDTGIEMPGIRFWCLGLKCERWDAGFYDMMVRDQEIWKREGARDEEKERKKEMDMLRFLGPSRKPVKW